MVTSKTLVPGPPSCRQNSRNDFESDTIDILARTIWGEARGEGTYGMHAVASVIVNRFHISRKMGSYWWGNTISGICRKPFQFSCWNADDPNLHKLLNVDDKDLAFQTAKRLARRAMHGVLADITGGATHYHARSVRPYWVGEARPSREIGNHIFYKLVEV